MKLKKILIIASIALMALLPTVSHAVNLPLVGEVDTKNISLPFLTLIIGALDGFNPCAMWILIFLITLLIGLKNRRRIWILGSLFIFTSAVIYFLFMTAWLNFFLLVGYVFWIRILIAVFALVAGVYNLREFLKNKDGQCDKTTVEKRTKIFDKVKNIVKKESLFLACLGVMVLAASVNLLEMLCSAGLPALYTSLLSLNNLPSWQYYLYMVFYIVIYMLDDLIVFFVAVFALRAMGISNKYRRATNLVGGIIMILIGILLLTKPGWLMFS